MKGEYIKAGDPLYYYKDDSCVNCLFCKARGLIVYCGKDHWEDNNIQGFKNFYAWISVINGKEVDFYQRFKNKKSMKEMALKCNDFEGV